MDWLLYDFVKNSNSEAIKDCLDWYHKQIDKWFQQLPDAQNNLSYYKDMVETIEKQIATYKNQIEQLTNIAKELGKL